MPISATGADSAGFTPLLRSTEHGFTPLLRSAEHGFTLVELLVVLAIIGMAGAAVVMAFPDPRGALRGDAERFAARAHAAQDAAVIEARDIALRVDRIGYGFERREREQWRPMTDKPFAPEQWPEGATVAGGSGRSVFDTTGLAEPLDVTLVRDDARVEIRIAADGTINVR